MLSMVIPALTPLYNTRSRKHTREWRELHAPTSASSKIQRLDACTMLKRLSTGCQEKHQICAVMVPLANERRGGELQDMSRTVVAVADSGSRYH